MDGENIVEYDQKQLRKFRQTKMAMVFQHFGLFTHRTIQANVEYGLEVRKIPKEERAKIAKEAIESVGLAGWEDYMPHQLSGGMQQRVGLARALANDPDVLLMDEPFSALDPLIRRDMQVELLELQSKLKKTIIFITHDVNEAFKLGDRVAVMKDGKSYKLGHLRRSLKIHRTTILKTSCVILTAQKLYKQSILCKNNCHYVGEGWFKGRHAGDEKQWYFKSICSGRK